MPEYLDETAWVERNFTAANSIEALSNYQDTDGPLANPTIGNERVGRENFIFFEDDKNFWQRIFDRIDNKTRGDIGPVTVELFQVALTEWTPRIPGLFWRPHSKILRKAAQHNIEGQTSKWKTYSPTGKSQKVGGGIGTIRLPPSESGYRLACATASLNASTGIPILIEEEVWRRKRLFDGSIINGEVILEQLPGTWARDFPIVKGIPKLCLVLRNPDGIEVSRSRAPVVFHPYSIMEYWDTDAQFLDFVYCQAETTDTNYRQSLETFFEYYRSDMGREGRYLTAADIAQPMWDAQFSSPADMRRDNAGSVKLIEARALQAADGEQNIDVLIRFLSKAQTSGDLKRMSELANIPWRRWFRENDSIVKQVEHLANLAIDDGEKLFRLTQAAQMEFSE